MKLGGSVIFSEALPLWLNAIAQATHPVILTTGGGKFADTIRDAYKSLSLSMEAAHEMAILSLNQSAIAIAEKHERFAVAQSQDEIAQIIANDQIPVWAPAHMCAIANDIEATWHVTSDSLALWLAGSLNLEQLLLIKSAPLEDTTLNANTLAKEGVIDKAFPEFLDRTKTQVSILCPGEQSHLQEFLLNGSKRKLTLAPQP